jgi:hypothetical protein
LLPSKGSQNLGSRTGGLYELEAGCGLNDRGPILEEEFQYARKVGANRLNALIDGTGAAGATQCLGVFPELLKARTCVGVPLGGSDQITPGIDEGRIEVRF